MVQNSGCSHKLSQEARKNVHDNSTETSDGSHMGLGDPEKGEREQGRPEPKYQKPWEGAKPTQLFQSRGQQV